jgi:uncharacterized phage protein (TIGR01671 family)
MSIKEFANGVDNMEDRYLFKAKRLNNGEWVQGYYVKGLDMYDKEVHLIFEPNTMFYSSGETDGWYKVVPSTICQCTGLKDKNGKLIWENDIVVCRDFTEEKYVIAWKQDEACFEYQQYGCSIMNFEQLSGCEVEAIGNIFDNKELLESEEN